MAVFAHGLFTKCRPVNLKVEKLTIFKLHFYKALGMCICGFIIPAYKTMGFIMDVSLHFNLEERNLRRPSNMTNITH